MCIPELFYNISLLCVNIRLFRSVKNRSSPDLIDTQSCTGSWTPVVSTEEHEMFNRFFFENFPSPLQDITSWRK